MLSELTSEQEKRLDTLMEEWVRKIHGGITEINESVAKQTLTKIYKLAELKKPDIVFCSGPLEAITYCRKTLKQNVSYFDWLGLGYGSAWISFCSYFQEIGVLEQDAEFQMIKDFLDSGVWVTILFDRVAICIARPQIVQTNAKNDLHCSNGPAIRFDDGYEEYAWNGVFLDKKFILNPEKITKEDIANEKNSEVSRAIAEILGWEEYMKRANIVLVDKWFDTDKSLHYELWDFKNRFELTPKLLKMESPELNDGTRPQYIEAVHPGLKSCQAARKWQFKNAGGSWPEVEECNKNPELVFDEEA